MPKHNMSIEIRMDDAFIAELIDERNLALARNRHLERMVEVQDQDLQAASVTIKALVANAQETIHHLQAEVAHLQGDLEVYTTAGDETVRHLQLENASMRQLITDAYNIHFDYCQNVSNEQWCALSISTLADMKSIALDHAHAQEQARKGGQS